MILEYVENGELFDYIRRKQCLCEEEAMLFFRQILSALGYCHSFNICHRDLKPENILLDQDGNVKIADFGMAALHQTPDHKLQTSCGSPHYAAPEVIDGKSYRGDKIDIWSMAVILYAALSGGLPFDSQTENVQEVLYKIRRVNYTIPDWFSDEVCDLIEKILKKNPADRLTIAQIWEHPLLKKYDYLDSYGESSKRLSADMPPIVRPVLRASEINRELLRHLKSLWHSFDEGKIVKLLLNDE
jgi:serine/threonine-protein kinase HSL1 (negative regulator of Swe1 kinase)